MPNEPDGDVLERFARGDSGAFETLFRRFQPEVYGWILRIVRNSTTAEDGVIESFWRAYRGRARFDTSRSFGAWMRRIATNVARDHLAAARRHASEPLVDVAAPRAPDPEIAQIVAKALRALSPRLQLVAALALIEEVPYAEIADAIGVPAGTVKSRVFRATRELRKEMARLGLHP